MENSLIGILVVSGIVWIVIAILVGKSGASRKIGFAGAFYASLFLSPILAMLFVLASDKTGASVITKSDKQAIWIPLFVIACIVGLIGILNYLDNQAWEKEYAERQRKEWIQELKEKQLFDSIKIVEVSKPKPVVCPRFKPDAWDILNSVTYNSNKSITLGYIDKITFSSSQIPALIKLVENAKKIEQACDNMNLSTEIRKYVGTVGQCKFYLEKDYRYTNSKYNKGEIKWWSSYEKIKTNVNLFTVNRDKYYEELRLWNEKERKDREAIAKL